MGGGTKNKLLNPYPVLKYIFTGLKLTNKLNRTPYLSQSSHCLSADVTDLNTESCFFDLHSRFSYNGLSPNKSEVYIWHHQAHITLRVAIWAALL